jgi:hypothetical protein
MMLYPRDPSLDPPFVWKGKDTQDRQDLVVSVYVQARTLMFDANGCLDTADGTRSVPATWIYGAD